MRKYWLLTITLLISPAACGGDPSPTELCERAVRESCSKAAECDQIPSSSEEICVTAAIANCANVTVEGLCPEAGQTFHFDKVDGCDAAVEAQSCADFLGDVEPAACTDLCTN